MLELSDKDFILAVIKMFQGKQNTLEIKEKIKKSQQKQCRSFLK